MSSAPQGKQDVVVDKSAAHEITHHVRNSVHRPDEKDDQKFVEQPELCLRRIFVPAHHVANEQGMRRCVKRLEIKRTNEPQH